MDCFGCKKGWDKCLYNNGNADYAKCISDIEYKKIIEAIAEQLENSPKIQQLQYRKLLKNNTKHFAEHLHEYIYNNELSALANLSIQMHNTYKRAGLTGYLENPVKHIIKQHQVYNRPIVIWGVDMFGSKNTYEWLKSIGVDVAFFIDNDVKKWYVLLWYRYFFDRPIYSPQEIRKNKQANGSLPYIVIAVSKSCNIIKNITNLGYKEKQDFCMGFVEGDINSMKMEKFTPPRALL
jgi:hypothetical protein